jgi:hypothetical protein
MTLALARALNSTVYTGLWYISLASRIRYFLACEPLLRIASDCPPTVMTKLASDRSRSQTFSMIDSRHVRVVVLGFEVRSCPYPLFYLLTWINMLTSPRPTEAFRVRAHTHPGHAHPVNTSST